MPEAPAYTQCTARASDRERAAEQAEPAYGPHAELEQSARQQRTDERAAELPLADRAGVAFTRDEPDPSSCEQGEGEDDDRCGRLDPERARKVAGKQGARGARGAATRARHAEDQRDRTVYDAAEENQAGTCEQEPGAERAAQSESEGRGERTSRRRHRPSVHRIG